MGNASCGKRYGDEVKAEAMRLREEEQLPVKVIAERLGISSATASLWLRGAVRHDGGARERVLAAGKRGHATMRAAREDAKVKLESEPPFVRTIDADGLEIRQRAAAAEAAVIFRMYLLGFKVYRPVEDGAHGEDLLARTPDGRYLRVQVRWVGLRKTRSALESLSVSLTRTVNGKSSRIGAHEYDVLAVYSLQHDAVFVWLSAELSDHNRTVALVGSARESWEKLTRIGSSSG